MHRTLCAMVLALAAASSARAADVGVLGHHVSRMKAGDLRGVLADYAPDAVVVAPPGLANSSGVFEGRDVRQLFSVLTDKDHVPGARSMRVRYEAAGPNSTVMHWVQFDGTSKRVSGHDVFVVRGGKIVFQSVMVDAAK
jgi:hypothetical protein